MGHIAKQQINSSFGTFTQGHEVPDDLPPEVRAAWLKAGIIGDLEEEAAPIERATATAPEQATAPAQRRLTKPKAVGSKPAPKG